MQKHWDVMRSDDSGDVAQRDRGNLEQELSRKRRDIGQIEGRYQQELQRAQADLQTMQTTLGPQHPDVAEALREVERRSIPPQELTGLRTEEANLINRLKSLDSRSPPPSREEPTEVVVGASEPVMDPALERAMDAYREVRRRSPGRARSQEAGWCTRQTPRMPSSLRSPPVGEARGGASSSHLPHLPVGGALPPGGGACALRCERSG